MGEICFLLILLAGLFYLYLITGTFPVNMLDNSGGASLFPRVVIIVLGVLLIIRVVQIIVNKETKKHFVFKELFSGSTGIFLLFIIFYILLFPVLGYVFATFLFSVSATTYSFYQKNGTIGTLNQLLIRTVVSLVGTLILYYFFSKVLFVRMPAGLLHI